jgi:hypothetical protein
MKIQLNDKRKVSTIQKEFSRFFPYLKIEFYSKPHKTGGASAKRLLKHGEKTLFECRTIHNNGDITITPQMTVGEFEQRFTDVYGLHVQVFRKSGKAWLQTTRTDNWTLEEQNSQGKELSESVGTVIL